MKKTTPGSPQAALYVPTLPDKDLFASDPIGLRPSDSGSNRPPNSNSEDEDEDELRDCIGYDYSDTVREWAENVGSTIDVPEDP